MNKANGWNSDCSQAPSGQDNFFIVRMKGNHPATDKSYLPVIVQQIDGELFRSENEIEPLVFGKLEPETNWLKIEMEWRPFPADWGVEI